MGATASTADSASCTRSMFSTSCSSPAKRTDMETEQAKLRRQERARKYYLDHREEIRAKSKAYYKAHPEKWKTYRRGGTSELQKEYNRECQRLYYQANRERCIAATRKWQAKNPDKVKAYQQKYLIKEKQKRAAVRIASLDMEKAKALFRDSAMAEHLQWLVDHAKKKKTNQETI